MDLLKNLNPEQLEAVKHKDGPLLIVAGAGTGKTTVITQRIAYLIEQGKAGPEEILALTFTEKAAGEMSDRVDALLPYGYFDLWISTFHSFAERILKEHGLTIGLPADFKLLNEFEQWALVKRNLDKFELDYYRPLGNPTKFIHALIKHFSRAKDEDISPSAYLAYAEDVKQNFDQMLSGGSLTPGPSPIPNVHGRGSLFPSHEERMGGTKGGLSADAGSAMTKEIAEQEAARVNEIANAYHTYQQLLLDNNALDFGDLINYCLKLFRDRPAVLEKYRSQFKYILLDEFQDTNWSQYELIKILAAPKNNLVVVGDDDQSIFRFRGASMSNILQFVKDYPTAKKIILTTNYRSRQNILDLSYEFIKQNNPNRLEYQLGNPALSVIPAPEPESSLEPAKHVSGLRVGARNDKGKGEGQKLNKKLISQNQGMGVIELIEAQDLAGEVEAVVDKIVELKNQPLSRDARSGGGWEGAASWDDFAILVRANDSANDFTSELDRRGLPYIFGASRGLYLKPVIMDAISYFKLLDNYHESAAVWRILKLPIYKFSDAELINFNHLAGKKALSLFEVLNQAEVFKFSAELQEKIKPVLALIAKHSALAREKSVSEVLLAFMNDSGYLKYLTRQAERQSLENISLLNQFLKRLKAFESASDDKTVKAFLAELDLELEAGEEGSLAADVEAGPEAIKILTVHGAKGLEFKYVFITNLVDKRFPTPARSEPISLPDALIKEILPEGDVHLEEERRLFYVAMTRAKAGLYFSWAKDYGGMRKKKPSRFLKELELIKDIGHKDKKLPEKKTSKISNFEFRISNEFLNSNLEIKNSKFNQNSKLKIQNSDNITNPLTPAHFSYSQLAAYQSCPYQYRFAHVLKIPVRGKEQFSFGKTMHATLEKLFALVKEKQGLKQGDLFGPLPASPAGGPSSPLPRRPASPELQRGEQAGAPSVAGEGNTDVFLNKGDEGGLKSNEFGKKENHKIPLTPFVKGGDMITFEEILKLYEQCWIDDWYESKQKKLARRKQGQDILKVFFEKQRNSWPKVLFLEKGFNLKINSGEESYVIRGVIDRIDETPAGLKLVDYKTGQAKKDLKFDDKEQLFIYQLAAQELFKKPISALVFYYLDNNSELEFIGETRDLEKLKNKIISTIEDIKLRDFQPKPGRLCAWCDFNGICEHRQ